VEKQRPPRQGNTGLAVNDNVRGFRWRQLWPLALLVAGFVAFFATGASDYLSLAALKAHHATLTGWVGAHLLLTSLAFVAVYAAMTALSLPGGLLATVVGGFLFGRFLGTFLVVIGATIGATVLFLAARSSVGETLRARAGPRLKRLEDGFRRDAFNYLLVLRLVPLFPFFLVNLAPAFLGVPLRTYVAATFIGIIPGTFVFAQVGTGLGSLLEGDGELSLSGILTPDIIAALCGLAALALVPVIYRRFFARPAPAPREPGDG